MNKAIHSLFIILILLGCSSSKKAIERGNYVEAVLKSVERLRQKPDHIKSQDALRTAYPLAIDFLESQATNAIASNAPFKWKQAVYYYNQVNYLHSKIKTSPAALTIIPIPENKFSEIVELKKKAAIECYEAGIQSMMKNTRQDAIQAYYLFEEANDFEPGIKDVVEMQHQAELNATLRIVYTQQTNRDWVSVEPIVNSLNIPFTKFYTPAQVQSINASIHQIIFIEVLDYNEGSPSTSKAESTYTDSVEVDKFSGGKMVKTKEKVTGKSILYEKKIVANGFVRVIIQENESHKQLMNNTFTGTGTWSDTWSQCSGDSRAIPEPIRKTCSKSEPSPEHYKMLELAREDVLGQIEKSLTSFYEFF